MFSLEGQPVVIPTRMTSRARRADIDVQRDTTGDGSERGRGTLVLLNSLATTRAMWDPMMAELSGGWDVLRYDQRDRGGPMALSPFRLDDLVADLIRVLDEAGVDRAHVAGVSLGGLIGLRAAATHPDRILSLTAMCCAARFSRATWVERGKVVRRDGVAPLIDGIIDRWFTREFQSEHQDLVASFRQMLATTDDDGYAHAADLLADADVRDDLAAIRVPTLVIAGAADTANPVSDLKMIAAAVPGSRLEILEGVGHLAPVAAPAAVAALLGAHTDAHSG